MELLYIVGFVMLYIIVWFIWNYFLDRNKNSNNEVIAKLMVESSNDFIQKLLHGEITPPDVSISLKKDEVALLNVPTVLSESKSSRVYVGAGTHLKGIYVGGGKSTSINNLREIDSGSLMLTNKSIYFIGRLERRLIDIKDVASIDYSGDGITISSRNNKNNSVFNVSNPTLWIDLVHLISGEKLQEPWLLNDGHIAVISNEYTTKITKENTKVTPGFESKLTYEFQNGITTEAEKESFFKSDFGSKLYEKTKDLYETEKKTILCPIHKLPPSLKIIITKEDMVMETSYCCPFCKSFVAEIKEKTAKKSSSDFTG